MEKEPETPSPGPRAPVPEISPPPSAPEISPQSPPEIPAQPMPEIQPPYPGESAGQYGGSYGLTQRIREEFLWLMSAPTRH